MNTFRFCKIDWLRCKSQLKILPLFPILAAFLIFTQDTNYTFAGSYLIFIAIILSTQPFTVEQTAESGFINMLPGSKTERVAGRFLYTLSLIIISVLCNTIISTVYYYMHHQSLSYVLPIAMILLGIALFVCSIQNTLLYILGKGKSQQMMGFIRILPGFIVFFAGTALIGNFIEEPSYILYWVLNHIFEVSLGCACIGVIIFILGIIVSGRIIKNKDLA